MEPQDPEDYLNYNYNSIYSNQFTENTPNEDQIINEDQSNQNLELQETINQKTKLEKIIDLMKCFICFGTVQDALMCPGCSNFACESCIKKYIRNKKECPVCRKDLTEEQVVKCRFLKDFSECIESFNEQRKLSSISRRSDQKKENCEEHNLKMIYFCLDCNTVVCSDCVMFTKRHKDHKFERVKTIYEQKMDSINKEINDLKQKIQLHDDYLKEIDEKTLDLKKNKEEKARDLIQLYRQLNQRLDQDLMKKLQKLQEEKKRAENEFEFYESMHQDIQSQIENSSASQVIKKANDFLQVLMEVNSKKFIKTLNHKQFDLDDDLSIPYFSSVFHLKPYSEYRYRNDIVYSDSLIADGIEWRIKVYPNGTGIYNGLFLSLFVEMVSGWENGGSYCYKVKLVNPNNEKESIQKEYISDFENSICWGYNRFCKIEDIENLGFWDKDNDQIIINYQVRPANHLQKLKDQENYIKFLEKKVEKKIQIKNKIDKKYPKNRPMSEEIMSRSYCGSSSYQNQRNKKNFSQVVISNKNLSLVKKCNFQSNKINKHPSINKLYKNDFSIERKQKKNQSLLNKKQKETKFQQTNNQIHINLNSNFAI